MFAKGGDLAPYEELWYEKVRYRLLFQLEVDSKHWLVP